MREIRATAGAALGALDPETDIWLARLAELLDPLDHVVGGGVEPDAVLRRDPDGWCVGAVVGEITLDGRRLRIVAPGGADADVAGAVGHLWCDGVEGATRHGPPAFRRDMPHVGASLRGRLDVRGSVRLRASGSSDIASVYRARDLLNDISRALVAADRALTRQIGHDRWRTRRVREVMPQIHAAVGPRASLPALATLARIRYTPITRPFKEVAEMSVRIVLQDPVVTTTPPGQPQGILVPAALAGAA